MTPAVRRAALVAGVLIASTLTVGVSAVRAAPEIRYGGSSTIGEHVILPAAEAFAFGGQLHVVAARRAELIRLIERDGGVRQLTIVLPATATRAA